MTENNAMSLKVFLRDGNGIEVKRFNVDAMVVTNYVFMKEKLQAVFPVLRNAQFKITWKDSDGDEITIASDEDFIIAFTEINETVKTLYVTVTEQFPEPFLPEEPEGPSGFNYPRVICDACNELITGLRYKCLQCPDYDLCATCSGKGLHQDHVMLRVPSAATEMPKYARKFMHYVARNLKRTTAAAHKEMHRASKHCPRFHEEGRRGGKERCAQTETGPSCSSAPNTKTGCPFNTDGITLKDIHAFGSIAKEQLTPVIEAIATAVGAGAGAAPPNSSSNNNNQPGGELITDLFRNVMSGFFGQEVNNQTQTEQSPAHDVNGNTGGTNQSVPMDVEGNGKEENVEKVKETATKPNDPGWIFVANNPQQQPEQPPQSQENVTGVEGNQENGTTPVNPATPAAPAAPALIYHQNPVIAEGLTRLHEMGFANTGGILTLLLERNQGNVSEVVKQLIELRN